MHVAIFQRSRAFRSKSQRRSALSILELCAAALAVAAAGCSSGGETTDASDGANAGRGGAAGASGSAGASGKGGAATFAGASGVTLDGTFKVELVPADEVSGNPAFSSVLGRVFDGPQPSPFSSRLDRELGDCQLLIPAPPFCDPACDSTAVCTAAGQCTPNPTAQNVGTVRVTGLGTTPLDLVATPPALNYQLATALPNPPCQEGADVEFEATSFTAAGKCIRALELGGPDPIPVVTGKAVDLEWAAPANPEAARIEIHLDISHHGGKKGEINCEVADTGSFTIPESLITRLVSLGVAGFPTIGVSRVATTRAADAPGVRLVFSSAVQRAVDTGVQSCTEDRECRSGTTCQPDLTCK